MTQLNHGDNIALAVRASFLAKKKGLSVRAKGGLVQIVKVTIGDNGKSLVKAQSKWLTPFDAHELMRQGEY